MKRFSLLALFSQQILIAVAIQANCLAQVDDMGAQAGSAAAMYELGERYANGSGVTQDIDQALMWYRKAAEKGEPQAMNSIARHYEEGVGVTQDVAQAAQWYRKGAVAGDVDAMFNLANCYAKGSGVEQSENEAFKWYHAAAQCGDTGAIQIVSEYSRRGIGAGKNEAKSEELNSRSSPSVISDANVRSPIPAHTKPENALTAKTLTAPRERSPKPSDSLTAKVLTYCAFVLAFAVLVYLVTKTAGPNITWEEIKPSPSESEKESKRLKEEAACQEAERTRKQAIDRKRRERDEKIERKRRWQISQQEAREAGEKLHEGALAYDRGRRLSRGHRISEAVDCFNKAIACGYVSADVYGLRGGCLQSLSRHQEAIKDFDKTIEMDPGDCNNYYMRAMSRSAVEDFMGVERDMRQAVRLSRVDSHQNRVYDGGVEKWGYSSATAYYESELSSLRMLTEGRIVSRLSHA